MPVCFSLSRKTSEKFESVPLTIIDDEICAFFGVEPDPIKYFCQWYDVIGFRLALGQTFAEIRTDFMLYLFESPKSAEMLNRTLEINDFLDKNFVSSSHREMRY